MKATRIVFVYDDRRVSLVYEERCDCRTELQKWSNRLVLVTTVILDCSTVSLEEKLISFVFAVQGDRSEKFPMY